MATLSAPMFGWSSSRPRSPRSSSASPTSSVGSEAASSPPIARPVWRRGGPKKRRALRALRALSPRRSEKSRPQNKIAVRVPRGARTLAQLGVGGVDGARELRGERLHVVGVRRHLGRHHFRLGSLRLGRLCDRILLHLGRLGDLGRHLHEPRVVRRHAERAERVDSGLQLRERQLRLLGRR
eukprot:6490395-Prymnesium_polylepis.1